MAARTNRKPRPEEVDATTAPASEQSPNAELAAGHKAQGSAVRQGMARKSMRVGRGHASTAAESDPSARRAASRIARITVMVMAALLGIGAAIVWLILV